MSTSRTHEDGRATAFQVWGWMTTSVSLYLLALGAFELGNEHDGNGFELLIAGALLLCAGILCFRISLALIRGNTRDTEIS